MNAWRSTWRRLSSAGADAAADPAAVVALAPVLGLAPPALRTLGSAPNLPSWMGTC